MKKNTVISVVFLLWTGLAAHALSVPVMKGPVTDLANIISAQDEQRIASFITQLDRDTGVQIAVLTVSSLEGSSIEDFANRTAQSWKLGQADKDNGVLLVVSDSDREVRIETGYGSETVLTDVKSGLIIRNVIIPEFRSGSYGTGIFEGVRNIAGVVTQNPDLVSERAAEKEDTSEEEGSVFGGILFFIILIIMLGGRGSLFSKLFLLNMLTGGRGRGGFGGGSSGGFGGFGGGGRSGGGFGGFSGGGGSFGGGGASGRW